MKINKLVLFIATTALIFITSMAFAANFYGASVIDKDVPTITWRVGIIGIRPIVNNVEYESPANKAGFKKGDIILSINNIDVKSESDLGKITGSTLKINIVNGITRDTLTIDKVAIQAVKAKENINQAAERSVVPTIIRQTSSKHATQDNLPPLKFDDAALERIYGKTTPAELARQRQSAERIENEDRARETTKNEQNAKNRAIENQRVEAERVKKQNELQQQQQQQQQDARRQMCLNICDRNQDRCVYSVSGSSARFFPNARICNANYDDCKALCEW